jgi:hypothetical protein
MRVLRDGLFLRQLKSLSLSQPRASTNAARKKSAMPSDFVMAVSCKAHAFMLPNFKLMFE